MSTSVCIITVYYTNTGGYFLLFSCITFPSGLNKGGKITKPIKIHKSLASIKVGVGDRLTNMYSIYGTSVLSEHKFNQ